MYSYSVRHTKERPQYKERRRVHREYPEPQAEALGLSIHHVQRVVEYAHRTAGKCLELRDVDIPYFECESQGLAGCSSQAYNTIIFPLMSVLEMLKNVEGGLEGWAYKPKRMKFLKGEISRIHQHEALPEPSRISWIRNLLLHDIGRIDEYYINSFTTFTNAMDPTSFALQYLHDTLQIICTQLEIPIPILSPSADTASASGTETETNSDPTPSPTSPFSIKSSASLSTLSASSSATIRPSSAPTNDDITEVDETKTEDNENENEDEQMPDQPLHASFEIYTDNSTNAFTHGMDGASDTFMEDLHAAAWGQARSFSPIASIDSDWPKPSPKATPSTRKPRTPSTRTSLSRIRRPHHAPARSIRKPIFPPKRKTYCPEPPSLPFSPSPSSHPTSFPHPLATNYPPLPPNYSPTQRLYTHAFHISAQALQQAKSLKEIGEKYGEMASEMGRCWEGWRGLVRGFEERVRGERGEGEGGW